MARRSWGIFSFISYIRKAIKDYYDNRNFISLDQTPPMHDISKIGSSSTSGMLGDTKKPSMLRRKKNIIIIDDETATKQRRQPKKITLQRTITHSKRDLYQSMHSALITLQKDTKNCRSSYFSFFDSSDTKMGVKINKVIMRYEAALENVSTQGVNIGNCTAIQECYNAVSKIILTATSSGYYAEIRGVEQQLSKEKGQPEQRVHRIKN